MAERPVTGRTIGTTERNLYDVSRDVDAGRVGTVAVAGSRGLRA
jgi:hypothetical protein